MRLKVTTLGLEIIPENDVDTVYVEKFLRLTQEGDFIRLVRQNAMGLSSLAFLTTHPFPKKEQREVEPA